MLSNKALKEAGFVNRVPVESLVVDEASQIDMGDFLPIIKLYSFRLKRVCFIGDDKQCQFERLYPQRRRSNDYF